MNKIWWWIGAIVVAVVAWWFLVNYQTPEVATNRPVKIGIITDLSGPAAYWGESTRIGANIAVAELVAEGIPVELVFEDYALDAAKAASAAQKLISIDGVDALYAEFNPGAIAVASVAKDKPVLYLFDAAVESPLEGNENAFKTYLDYRAGCRAIAEQFKSEGVATVGMLKVGLEFGELCLQGVREVYANPVVEGYTLGDTDFRTQLTKLKSAKVGAVINVGFEGDTANTLKGMKDLGIKVPYGTVDDTITDVVKAEYADELKGAASFGFPTVDLAFAAKLLAANNNTKLATDYGAALAYTHVIQIAHAIAECVDTACVAREMSSASADNTIGFKGFINRIADLDLQIKSY
ncbi:MAG: ABC transporter substrate-binding protein [Patescibacteria group bacterium]